MIDDPEQLRARAADMRARAERAQFPETKQGLLRIAGDYVELAKRAERVSLGGEPSKVLARTLPKIGRLSRSKIDGAGHVGWSALTSETR